MKTPCQHAYINVQTKGDLSSLSWIESPLKHYTDHDQKQLCHVHYAALNFRDVMLATGRLPADAIPGNLATQDCILGMEVSGLDEMGERVMALVPAKVNYILVNYFFILLPGTSLHLNPLIDKHFDHQQPFVSSYPNNDVEKIYWFQSVVCM